ncbi:hypothetical protein [Vreelandella populi]|uniref:Phage tail protein n=1 Tax=Vreelandella populi TaxID=2498858 RepID=A0A3S0WZC6_9GAMM|nr:hypothetical protein [Halomonas populi]RUR43370.1 hypothetical protein ELY37_16770 [Halomonas populi]
MSKAVATTATTIKLTSAVTITVDVPYTDPIQGAQTFQATWKLHKWDEYRGIVTAQQAGEKTDEDLMEDLVRLDGLKDSETKEQIAHCDELVDAAMSVTFMRRPLILSWFAAQEGRNQAAAKN